MHPGFLYHWFLSSTGQASLSQTTIGVAQPAYTIANLKRVTLAVPEEQEQNKIASTLGSFSDLIQNNRMRIALLELAVKELYREWFVRMRFPDWQSTDFEKGIPVGWRSKRLEQIAEINSESISASNHPDEIEYVDIGSVTTNRINDSTRMPYEEAPGRARRKVKHGDVIWSSVRPGNRAYCLIYEPARDLVVSTGFAVIRANPTIPFTFLHQAVTTNAFADEMVLVAKGAAYPATSFDDFGRAQILVPTQELMDRFHEFAHPKIHAIQKLLSTNTILETSKGLLRDRIFSGNLAVNDKAIRTHQRASKACEDLIEELVHA